MIKPIMLIMKIITLVDYDDAIYDNELDDDNDDYDDDYRHGRKMCVIADWLERHLGHL